MGFESYFHRETQINTWVYTLKFFKSLQFIWNYDHYCITHCSVSSQNIFLDFLGKVEDYLHYWIEENFYSTIQLLFIIHCFYRHAWKKENSPNDRIESNLSDSTFWRTLYLHAYIWKDSNWWIYDLSHRVSLRVTMDYFLSFSLHLFMNMGFISIKPFSSKENSTTFAQKT